eukprot:CAMPEP_0173454892 /NCGR_PEP_ID=MMETSP1357-20121228/53272_1 /TAXON_ID=77926 /ORGANISM="Hemiselmis rufescens, Strain PCC563" /LENGTH=84 /DNA_ID=CAMNT_0014421971 /DNA_START=76 /DNA_END=326 /DNA_ORIENTATION=+
MPRGKPRRRQGQSNQPRDVLLAESNRLDRRYEPNHGIHILQAFEEITLGFRFAAETRSPSIQAILLLDLERAVEPPLDVGVRHV